MSTKVLGISGSPKRGGNTERLLDKALEGASAAGSSIKKFILNEMKFQPCQECGGCSSTGICIIDDGLRDLYKEVAAADGIIVATPVFFGSVSAQLKAMIDRFQCAWVAKHDLKRPWLSGRRAKGAFICVSHLDRIDFFECAEKVVKNFFATLVMEYVGGSHFIGLAREDEAASFAQALQGSYDLGRRVAR